MIKSFLLGAVSGVLVLVSGFTILTWPIGLIFYHMFLNFLMTGRSGME